MDDVSFSKKTNISAIFRVDQSVKDIIISASQVALYVFDAKKTKWIKRKVEGACFFYKRKTSPKYGIFILNRLDTTNFIELLNSSMEIQLQEPFILYRSTFKTIYGIWFYDKSECVAMANVFERVILKLKEQEKTEPEEDDTDMLMKDKSCATDSLDQNPHDGDSNSRERKPSGQPESVRQFFAIASKEATKNQPGLQQSSVQNPICSKSLCSSFQSVAHIEKKQTNPNSVNMIETNMKSLNMGNSFDQFHKVSPVTFLDNVEHKFPRGGVLKEEQEVEFPELIPPRMLVTPYDLSASISNCNVADKNSKTKVDIMSKNQMLQAMEYLLKNDSQFVDKLYDAYLKISKN